MSLIKEIKESVLQLFFPHVCTGCGSDSISPESMLCIKCIAALPETNFELYPGNPVEKTFWGRAPLHAASACYYFTKESLVQHLMHQFKYKRNKELGLQLGKIMGAQLMRSGRFNADILIPLPLFPAKEKRRGYNQATVLCKGIAEALNMPVVENAVIRSRHTETQTKKGRVERWKNIDGKFLLTNPGAVRNKHLLLVDDVVTTGATLEACCHELLKADGITLSIATLCTASR